MVGHMGSGFYKQLHLLPLKSQQTTMEHRHSVWGHTRPLFHGLAYFAWEKIKRKKKEAIHLRDTKIENDLLMIVYIVISLTESIHSVFTMFTIIIYSDGIENKYIKKINKSIP